MQTHVCSPSYVRSLNPSVSPNHGNSRLTHVISGSDLKFEVFCFVFSLISTHIYNQEISASIPPMPAVFVGDSLEDCPGKEHPVDGKVMHPLIWNLTRFHPFWALRLGHHE